MGRRLRFGGMMIRELMVMGLLEQTDEEELEGKPSSGALCPEPDALNRNRGEKH